MNVNAEKPAPGASRAVDAAKWLVVVGLLAAAVVGNAVYAGEPLLWRVIGGLLLVAAAAGLAAVTDKGREFVSYSKEARVELRKIVWPTRQERLQTTLVVFVVVAIMAILLWAFDWVLSLVISNIIG